MGIVIGASELLGGQVRSSWGDGPFANDITCNQYGFAREALQIPHKTGNCGESAPRRFRLGRIRVYAQKVFRTRSAHHTPTDLAEIDFDAVHVFAAGDRPVEKNFQLPI